jgi:hypothetical protein
MGRPKGSKNKATMEREAAIAALNSMAKEQLDGAQPMDTTAPTPKRVAPDIQVSEKAEEIQESIRTTKSLDAAADIVKQRLAAGVFQSPSRPIRLKDNSLVCRWFNSDKSSDHIWRAKNVQGWVSVTPDMLADPDQVGGYTVSPTGSVVRGQRGSEHLMCMDRDLLAQVARAKEGKHNETIGNPAKIKSDLANHMAATHGSEAGDFVHRNVIGEVTDSRVREEMPDEYREKV